MGIYTVSGYLSIWEKHFDGAISKSRFERFWILCHGTGAKWALLVGFAVQTLSMLDCIMARSSVLDAGPTIRFVFGIYSCTWCVYVYACKSDEVLRTVSQLLRVARAVEADLDHRPSDIKVTLSSAAKRASRYLRGMELWSAFVFVTVIPPALITGKPANPSWPEPTTPTGRYALLTLHMFSTVFLPVGFFAGIAMLFGLQNCCTALLHALGRRLELASSEKEIYDTVALTSELNKGLAMLNQVYLTPYMHMMLSTLAMPLMAMYEVINGQFDPFLYSTGPLNVVIFIPLCFAGQGVESAGHNMCHSAYAGPWDDENVRCRLMRLQVMIRAAQPAQCKSRELGAVNLALCQNSLRSWFSFLNFMLTTQKTKEA